MSQIACTQCNGTGWLNCPDCNGEGITFRLSRGAKRNICARCLGRGVLGRCSSCNGTGRMDKVDEIKGRGADSRAIMEETYDFSEDQIRSRVEKGRIGNYALGFSAMHKDINVEVFHPTFVGRSDTDLQEELLMRLAKRKPWYDRFKFNYATTVREAFERECREFHLAVGGIDSEAHPQRPKGTDFPCPVPNCKSLEF